MVFVLSCSVFSLPPSMLALSTLDLPVRPVQTVLQFSHIQRLNPVFFADPILEMPTISERVPPGRPGLPGKLQGMREILRKQIEQHKVVFDAQMSAADQSSVLFRLMILQGLLFGDVDVANKFVGVEYWESLSEGQLHVSQDLHSQLSVARHAGYCRPDGFTQTAAATAVKELENEGYTNLPAPCPPDLVSALHRTIGRLQACGWPAPFLLVYDEAWLLVDGIWSLYTNLLGVDCRLEADLNVWALLSPEQEQIFPLKQEQALPDCSRAFALPPDAFIRHLPLYACRTTRSEMWRDIAAIARRRRLRATQWARTAGRCTSGPTSGRRTATWFAPREAEQL
jgi:hypothetical protein